MKSLVLLLVFSSLGCNSPYYADRGALFGGLAGAGTGAIIGNAVGSTGAGAVIGAGLGTLTGAAVGGSLDEIEARNRAQIAAQMGAAVPPGAVTMADVVNMSQAGVSDALIISHIQHNGLAAPLTSPDLIYLKQQNVSDAVIQAMQAPPAQPVAVAAGPPVYAGPPPVIVKEHYYGPPRYHYHHRHRWGGPPRTSFGFSVSR